MSEYVPTMELRFVVRVHPKKPDRTIKLLQQKWRSKDGVQWRTIPLVTEEEE